MKITRLLIAVALAANSVGPACVQAKLDRVYAINIKVFEIPPIQSVTSAGPDGKGGIVGTTIGGNVNSNFPAEPVFIQTELGPGAADEDMKNVLYDRGYLSRCGLPKGASWYLDGSYSLYCRERDLGTEAKRTEYDKPAIEPSRENHFWKREEFHLTVFPLSVKSGEAALNLKFAAKVKMSQLDPGINQALLDQDFKVALGKTALVGFPQLTALKSGRGTVYVLAVCVQEQDIQGF